MKDIKTFIIDNAFGDVVVNQHIRYKQSEIIDNIQAAIAGRFRGGDYEDDGKTKKYYFNIGWILSRSAFYASDIDTKDMNIRGLSSEGMRMALVLRPAIQTHLRLTHFGRIIEEARWKLISEGHVILKIVDGEVFTVDLRNMIRPANNRNIQDVDFIEKRLANYWEIEDKVEGEVKAQIKKMNDSGVDVFNV
jgi:hypothetical protein